MPLHVRAGAILPFGPIRQYVDEPVDGLLTLVVYPGADGAFTLYEDDGRSFNYRRGEWMGVVATWDDSARRLSLRLAAGSRMLPPLRREIEIRIAGDRPSHRAVFTGMVPARCYVVTAQEAGERERQSVAASRAN